MTRELTGGLAGGRFDKRNNRREWGLARQLIGRGLTRELAGGGVTKELSWGLTGRGVDKRIDRRIGRGGGGVDKRINRGGGGVVGKIIDMGIDREGVAR